MYRSRVCL